ncbi:MAG TPA: PIN domain-containing protein [Solirubrobacterales bacterium]|nr:PIN domain-containing protein [Solirubrobacterales bacterium]
MAVVLDSDAVIGFLDRGDALHAAAEAVVREYAARGPLLASVVTYAEVLTGARLGYQEESLVEGFFADLISTLLPVDEQVADRAAQLRAESRSLRMPDALILASADLEPEADLLVSGDLAAAKVKGIACDVHSLVSRPL